MARGVMTLFLFTQKDYVLGHYNDTHTRTISPTQFQDASSNCMADIIPKKERKVSRFIINRSSVLEREFAITGVSLHVVLSRRIHFSVCLLFDIYCDWSVHVFLLSEQTTLVLFKSLGNGSNLYSLLL